VYGAAVVMTVVAESARDLSAAASPPSDGAEADGRREGLELCLGATCERKLEGHNRGEVLGNESAGETSRAVHDQIILPVSGAPRRGVRRRDAPHVEREEEEEEEKEEEHKRAGYLPPVKSSTCRERERQTERESCQRERQRRERERVREGGRERERKTVY
jgi:hypothetical protein